MSDLNMSHGEMYDFVSFPLSGFTLVIKLRSSNSDTLFLYPGHPIKSCQKKGKCFSCKSQNHHTAICEKLESSTPQTTENKK